jgi:hypothetical protein
MINALEKIKDKQAENGWTDEAVIAVLAMFLEELDDEAYLPSDLAYFMDEFAKRDKDMSDDSD